MSGRVPGIVAEVGNARQLPKRNAPPKAKKGSPGSHPEEPQAIDQSELAVRSPDADEDGADAGHENDADDLSLATANGLTLSDVKAAYESN